MSKPDDPWGDFWLFRSMITPTIMRIVFVIGLILIPIIAIGFALEGTSSYDSNRQVNRVVAALIFCTPLAWLAWRVACESALVLFMMAGRMGDILEELRRNRGKPDSQNEVKTSSSGPTNPNLFPCPECGHYVSRLAKACPKCGQPVALTPEQPSGAGGS